ncbi:MAG: SGNH/GDSL hydrolase family protein [Cytophagaceae bacterium]
MTSVKNIRLIFLPFTVACTLLLCLSNCKKKKEEPVPDNQTSIDTSTQIITADNANIQYSGRIDFTNPAKPTFSAPAVYVTAKFKGTSCRVIFHDEFLYSQRNLYQAIIDDTISVKIEPTPLKNIYMIDSTLVYGTHTVVFTKRTESGIGRCQFMGFRFSEILSPDPKPSRRMQFIGNSISCGSGNEAANNSSQCSEDSWYQSGGWGQAYHNGHLSFGPVAARALDAEYHVTAVSGIGLIRNYSNQYDPRTLPQVYDRVFLQDSSTNWNPNGYNLNLAWDHSLFIPDVVVIELGTNDFSPGDSPRANMDSATYTPVYISFVNRLRGYFPNAHIVCLSSPMLSDGWPNAGDKNATNQKKSIAGVEQYFNNNGDTRVHKFYVTKLNGGGCGTHPSAAQDQFLADELAAYIRTITGW